MKYIFKAIFALVGIAFLTVDLTSESWRPWINGAGIVVALAYAFVIRRDDKRAVSDQAFREIPDHFAEAIHGKPTSEQTGAVQITARIQEALRD